MLSEEEKRMKVPARDFSAYARDSLWMGYFYDDQLKALECHSGLTALHCERIAHDRTILEYLRRRERSLRPVSPREEEDDYKARLEEELVARFERDGYDDAFYDYKDPYV